MENNRNIGPFLHRYRFSTSTKDLLKKYFTNPDMFEFFDKLCSAYSYTTAEETPGVMAATMFIDNHVGGVYFPAGGAQMLPNVIEKSFERDGGQTLYHQRVDEILIQNNKAYGVRLRNGTEIRGERIIANSTVWNIYGELVRPQHISSKRMEWVKSLIPTFPSMTLCMVIDREGLPEDIFPWEIYIENRKVIDSSDLTLYINSLVDETLCQPDHLVVMVIAPNMQKWPHSTDPAYRSDEYENLKKREAERMLDQIEMHIPNFRQHIRQLIIGSPTTIERFLLKNGGAVGFPKNQIGQEMLKRLHARSEWKNLYFCGDSTVMATGAPATVVSGIGAANVILRDLHLPDYDAREFPKQFVLLVYQPCRRPDYKPTDEITDKNAWIAASQCQGCLEPECVKGCPAGIDIPGFLRRMEAKNYSGAARLIREKNPLGEVCGVLCAAERLCQRDCYRRDFDGKPVRIAELQRWVCAEAGENGWLKPEKSGTGPKVAVIGGGPSALSCAYYLSLAGCQVTVFVEGEYPGGELQKISNPNHLLLESIQHDVDGVLLNGITYVKTSQHGQNLDFHKVQDDYRAAYLSNAANEGFSEANSAFLETNWRETQNQQTGQIANHPGVFVGAEFLANGISVVEAAANGRKAAMNIWHNLTTQV
ncbi:MAG: FAD-dependent oxidoreductase [Anaerolineaceae bacterium]|nr:FAD-dependent oxidoreductase [Anaerolineaceae bacterium]